MTFDELYAKIHIVLPNAVFDEDNEGQIVIYTGLHETADGDVEEME